MISLLINGLNPMKAKLFTTLTVTLLTLIGCASVPMSDKTANDEALKFTPPPGMANIYIIRDELGATALLANATIDGQRIADLPTETYVMKSISPGVHTIGCINLNNNLLWTPITLTAQAGQNYFFETECSFWAHRFPIKQVTFEEAREMLKSCDRVQGM